MVSDLLQADAATEAFDRNRSDDVLLESPTFFGGHYLVHGSRVCPCGGTDAGNARKFTPANTALSEALAPADTALSEALADDGQCRT